jgi:hypothetical protein
MRQRPRTTVAVGRAAVSIDDMVVFVQRQLDADEHLVRAAEAELAAWGGSWTDFADNIAHRAVIEAEAMCDHIERHHPQDVLADVAAKRAILADIEEATGVSGATWLLAERTIRHLAAGYRHRAGWCEEWVV